MHATEDPAAQPGTVLSALPGRLAPALPIWGWLAAAVGALLFWTVLMEAGVVSTALGQSGPFLHELFHDGRHLVGVPCH